MSDVDNMLPSRIQFALSVWAENTGNEWNGEEIREAADTVGHLKLDEQVQVLTVAQELWTSPPREGFDAHYSELDWVALVVKFYEEGFTGYDDGQMRDALTSVHQSEDEALLAGLGMLKDQARATGRADELEGLTLASLDSDNRREMHLWMTNVAPGYDWFYVEGIGHVLYRLS